MSNHDAVLIETCGEMSHVFKDEPFEHPWFDVHAGRGVKCVGESREERIVVIRIVTGRERWCCAAKSWAPGIGETDEESHSPAFLARDRLTPLQLLEDGNGGVNLGEPR